MLLGHENQVRVLFRGHDADLADIVQGVDKHVVGIDIELLNLFSLDIPGAGAAEYVFYEPGMGHLGRHHLCSEDDLAQDDTEIALAPVFPLLVHDVPVERDDLIVHNASPFCIQVVIYGGSVISRNTNTLREEKSR